MKSDVSKGDSEIDEKDIINQSDTEAEGEQDQQYYDPYAQFYQQHDPYAQNNQFDPYAQFYQQYDPNSQNNEYNATNDQYNQYNPKDQYNGNQDQVDNVNQAFDPLDPLNENYFASFDVIEVPKQLAFLPNKQQKEALKVRLRNKFRHTMPFDWLGQKEKDWYSSWILSQNNFISFRLGIILFVVNCVWKLLRIFLGYTWTSIFEIILDPTSFFRYFFTLFGLFGLLVGIGGSTVLSIAKLFLSQNNFRLLCQYKNGKGVIGYFRSFMIFTINHAYDSGLIFAFLPFILYAYPKQIVLVKVSLSAWNTLLLPVLVLMDLWMTKRCRIDTIFIKRHLTIFLRAITFLGVVWAIVCKVLWIICGIHRKPGGYLIIEIDEYFKIDIGPYIIGSLQNLILFLFYWTIQSIITDFSFDFLRFKANYLLINHSEQISGKDVNNLAKIQAKYYKKKMADFDAKIAEMYGWNKVNTALEGPVDTGAGVIECKDESNEE